MEPMSSDESTIYDRAITWCKNQRVVVALLFITILLGGLATWTDSIGRIISAGSRAFSVPETSPRGTMVEDFPTPTPTPITPPPTPDEILVPESAAESSAAAPQRLSTAELAATTDPNYHPITLLEYFRTWYADGFTDLQRDEFEASLLGKRVVWDGTASNIAADSDGNIDMYLNANDGSYGTAFLEFEAVHRPVLLTLREGVKLRVTCVITGYVASPFLKQCSVIRVLD